MAEININDLQEYDFKNAQKGDIVVVATIIWWEIGALLLIAWVILRGEKK